MSTYVPFIPRVIPAIRIQIQAQRIICIRILPSVLLRESAICAVVISRTQVYRLRLLVEILPTVTEWVVVRVERIPFPAKRVIGVRRLFAGGRGRCSYSIYHIWINMSRTEAEKFVNCEK